ncbi:hypothetical protein TNCV_1619531 [Trichonephila clavipes]|nr:hypothetical protein TNCV_1619531 [Trichonephila clavipes]
MRETCSAASDKRPLRSSTAFRIMVLNPSIPYSANSHCVMYLPLEVHPSKYQRELEVDEAHFWLNGYVNTQNCRIWSEANPQVYVETPLHPEKLTVWCPLWAGRILLQKR